MSEDSEQSDVSRSKRALLLTPGVAQRISTDEFGHSALNITDLTGVKTKKTAIKLAEQRKAIYSGEVLFDDQVPMDNSGAMDGSWEEPHSFDDGEHPRLLSNRPSSRANIRDRRKQFDATTPTLVDEEDDTEILTLDQPRTHHVSFNEKDESFIRRTPGASMYKSSFEPTPEEASNMRKTPGAATMRRSAASLPQSIPNSYLQHTISLTDQTEPPGLGFDLSLSTSAGVGNIIDSKGRKDRSMWEPHFRERAFSKSSVSSVQLSEDLSSQHTDSFGLPIKTSLSANSTSSVGSGQTQDIRGPFSFAPWSKSSKFEQSHYTNPYASEGRPGTTGAFSPNILRLTEDIGNLLHEDEDDDVALEITNVFRAEHHSPSEDWTGSYVFDKDSGRRTSKPAVPSRSSNTANMQFLQKDSKNRRRAPGTGFQVQTSQQQYPGLLPNTQQPKPRIRASNEVFEFGKPSHADPHHILNFGGAFAPPSAILGGNNPNSVRSALVSPYFTDQPRDVNPLMGQQHNSMQHSFSFGQTTGNVYGGSSNSSLPIHSTAFDSLQLKRQSAVDDSGRYFQSHSAPYIEGADSFGYGMTSGTPYESHQSEMQATSREFVPAQRANSGSAPYSNQIDWQVRPHPGRMNQYEAPIDEPNWHQSNPAYRYGGNYEYGISQPSTFSQQHFTEHRSALTPSPHMPPWQHPDQISQHQVQKHQPFPPHVHLLAPMPSSPATQMQQNHKVPPPPVSNTGVVFSTSQSSIRANEIVAPQLSYRGAASPHLSVAGSEQSQNTSQIGKKDPKRRQRGKKKGPKPDSPSTKKALVPQKKKGAKGESRSLSAGQTHDGHDDHHASASEDPNDAKKSELIESSSTRAAFKEFYRAIRSEERLSFQKAEIFALESLTNGSLPDSVHWRVYLELADLAKRSNRYVEARRLYKMVCQLQPYASQGWLEYSKLEEECGHMNRVMNIIHSGLEYCTYSESLLTRAVKHQEKMGNLASARALLARLKHVGIEKVWRTVLEGALLEARAGNVSTARRVLKYLMHHVPWYGPLYLEAYRLEKDQGHPLDALQIVERGLQAIPRYGPLWFGAFRLCEDLDRSKKLHDLPQSMEMIERAAVSISKELVWKVHLEAAQMLERSAFEKGNPDDPEFDDLLVPARRRLAKTILTCPSNLRWKVWLAAARMELGIGRTERARELFLRSHEVVPKKGRSSTLLENARLEDFVGDTNLARAILCKGRLIFCHDWKVWLESVLLEIRCGNVTRAMEICTNALEVHQGTGRLWATLVQLRQFNGRDEAQRLTLRLALNAVPKSGEVWCEGGRIHLNPFSDTFDLVRARRHLFFATRFTPQYGDGFVETIRLELIDQWLLPVATFIWEKTKLSFNPSSDAGIANSLTKYITDVSLAVAVASLKDTDREVSNSSLPRLVHRAIVPEVRKKLKPETLRDSINLNDLRLACVNADPNYGLLWFHCRRRPIDTPRRIIEDAAGDIAAELQKYAHIYLAAIIRRFAVLSTFDCEKPERLEEGVEISDPVTATWNDYIDEKLQTAPSLEEIFNPIDPTTGLVLLENTISGSLFVTGLCDLNKHTPMSSLSLAERRRSLFGNDALFP